MNEFNTPLSSTHLSTHTNTLFREYHPTVPTLLACRARYPRIYSAFAAICILLGIMARAQSDSDAISILPSSTTTVLAGKSFGWGSGIHATTLVAESGRKELTFQWFKDGAPIEGANRRFFVRLAAEADDGGSYFLRVTSPTLGAIDSKSANLIVNAVPAAPSFGDFSAVSSPFGLASTIQAGTRCALEAPPLESGTGPFTYQWRKNGETLPGETRATLFRAAWSVTDGGSYRITISNPLGSTTSAPRVQDVTDQFEKWEWAAPLPSGNPLGNVVWLNGRFLAGGARGTLLDSTDGSAWQLRRFGGSADVGPFAFGNGTYVALATAGGIFTSRDAITWTARESGLTDGRTLLRIAHGGGRFIAVGTRGTLLVSIDGNAWQPATVGTTQDIAAVAFGNGRWLVCTAYASNRPAESPKVFSSDDGVTWTPRSFTPEPTAHLAFGGGVFVVAPAGDVESFYTSPDGLAWTRRTSSLSFNPVASLQHTDAGFLAAVPFAPSFLGPAVGRLIGPSDGNLWFVRTFQPAPLSPPTDLTFDNGRFVMTAGASDPLRTSTDGFTWSTPSQVDSRTIYAIAANTTTAVAVGGALSQIPETAVIRTTYDGTTWFTRQTSINADLRDVAYGAGAANTFVAVGDTRDGRSVVVASPDGLTWSERHVIQKNNALSSVTYVNGRFLAVGNNTMLSSVDGLKWDAVRLPGTPYLSRVAYGAGAYVAAGEGGILLRSTDAITWTPQPTDITPGGNSAWSSNVIFAAGKFVAATVYRSATHNVGHIATSPDGLVWTTRWTDPGFLGRLIFAGNRFVALRSGSGGAYLVSDDGETWSLALHGNSPGMLAIAEFKNRVILGGESGAILTQLLTPPVGSSFPIITAKSGDQAVRTGQNVFLSTTATGTPATAFQWLKNSTPIPGATNSSLTLGPVQFTDAGSYACVISTPAGAVTATSTLGVAPASQLSNLSIRTTLADAQSLVVGLTVGGLGGTKPMLFRAAGPALSSLGVPSTTSDPRLELYFSGQKISENDNWSSDLASTFAQIGAFAFPASSKDAAILRRFAGSVSAVASATGPGAILVEAYDTDLSSATSARLTNLSARNRVGTGSDILIAGLNIAGTGTLRLLIRGVGPTLAAFGVTAPLANPQIAIYDPSGAKIADNDDWPAGLAPTFTSVGAFALPSSSRDAALIATLSAGRSYTVQVSGVAGTTGEALVEIYELP